MSSGQDSEFHAGEPGVILNPPALANDAMQHVSWSDRTTEGRSATVAPGVAALSAGSPETLIEPEDGCLALLPRDLVNGAAVADAVRRDQMRFQDRAHVLSPSPLHQLRKMRFGAPTARACSRPAPQHVAPGRCPSGRWLYFSTRRLRGRFAISIPPRCVGRRYRPPIPPPARSVRDHHGVASEHEVPCPHRDDQETDGRAHASRWRTGCLTSAPTEQIEGFAERRISGSSQ